MPTAMSANQYGDLGTLTFEPRTEVPDNTIFGRLPERQAPHIYTDQEIVDLLAAARRLGPAPGFRGIVFETLFGALLNFEWVTGHEG